MKEIKAGDYVKLKNGHAGYIYKVTYAEDDVPRICVDYKQNVFSTLAKDEVEKIDPKTAFITELRDLLAKYDAAICDYEAYRVIFYLNYNEDAEESIGFDTTDRVINANNVMDFD